MPSLEGAAKRRSQSAADKVCEECEALDRFQQASAQLRGTVARGGDPPDFSIETDTGLVAVEMTRYHHGSGPRGSAPAEHEALEIRVAAAAKAQFELEHPNVYLIVQPHLRPGSLNRRNVPLIAERLARLVGKVMPEEPAADEPLQSVRATWDVLASEGLAEPVINLVVYRLPARRAAMQGNSWGRVSGHMSTDTSHLETLIREKERDLPRYKDGAGECWLIIYAPPFRASGFFDLEVLRRAMWRSTFDRVVFLDVLWARYVTVV